MSQNDPFTHPDPAMAYLLIAVYRAVERQNNGELVLLRKNSSLTDLAYEVHGRLENGPSKKFRNADKSLPMLAVCVKHLISHEVLSITAVDKGQHVALSTGRCAPKQLPELPLLTKARGTTSKRRSERRFRANRPMAVAFR